jgi:hypothetical protein
MLSSINHLIFKDLISCTYHQISLNSSLTYCFFINITAYQKVFVNLRPVDLARSPFRTRVGRQISPVSRSLHRARPSPAVACLSSFLRALRVSNTEGTERLCGLCVNALPAPEDTETPPRDAAKPRQILSRHFQIFYQGHDNLASIPPGRGLLGG